MEELAIVGDGSGGEAPQETTQFLDTTVGESVGAMSAVDEISKADALNASLIADFLARPVRIKTFTWSTSDATGPLFTTTYPWQDFFDNQYIKYKVNNFAFVRCNLKLKVVVNASPFYYGSVRMVYTPLSAFRSNEDISATSHNLMQASQKPGVWLDPSRSEGAEMTLPFVYIRNKLALVDSAAFADMGDIRFYCYAPLISANGVATSSVSIQVYAWAENVELTGPTINTALQGDEYGTGVVSGPATAVANVARAAKNIPVIGKFAAATEVGASAVSKIAKMFGFTNTPVLSDTQPFRQTPLPQLASTEIGYPVEKLTVDAKNELSIDPSIVGLPGDDELAISGLVARDTVIAQASWSSSDAVDARIFSSRLQPYMWKGTAATGGTLYTFTTPAYVSHLFTHWRGDLIFTFKIVASPYHKGRLRISYDPQAASMLSATDIGSVLQNVIVDLGVSREVEIRVPYQQALSWLKVDKDLDHVPFTYSGLLNLYDGYDNGMLTVKVLTTLSAPVTAAPVTVLVSVRGAENLEFANPDDLDNTFTPFPIQGEEVMTASLGPASATDENIYRVNFGEKIASVRPLLRRSNWLDSVALGNSTGTAANVYMLDFPRRAPYVGYDSGSWTYAKGLVATATNLKFNWTKLTAWHWMAPAFVAQRGAFHWHFNIQASSAVQNVMITRRTGGSNSRTISTTSSTHVDAPTALFTSTIPGTTTGTAATNGLCQPCMSVSAPNMSAYRFEYTNPTYTTTPITDARTTDGSQFEYLRLSIMLGPSGQVSSPIVNRYFAVGTDFSLHYFVCCPQWYKMPSWRAFAT